MEPEIALAAVGVVRSALTDPAGAPRQGREGAPDAWLELEPGVAPAAADLRPGDRVVVLTWLHLGRRDVLQVHPRDDPATPLTGVFSTRSQDRPNPIGLHDAEVLEVDRGRDAVRVRVAPLEAVDGTPVLDVKVALPPA